MSRPRIPFTAILVVAFLMTGSAARLDAQQRCGRERWSVKTGTDADAANIDLSNAQNTTIAQLIALAPPSPIPVNNRFAPTEDTVFVVNATLVDYKLEGGHTGDSDYHLVLQDDQGNSMVAEIPFPGCVGNGSPFAAQIANARAKFDAQFTATTSFQTANIPVQIKGVGFFDFAHGQHGAAPNVIELHPILDIVFNPGPGDATDFALSETPSPINLIQGGVSSASVTTAMSSRNSGSAKITVSGLPPGISSQITPAGTGASTLSLTASSAAPTGSFPLTITAIAGARSHSTTVPLNVSSSSTSPGTQQWEYKLITASSENDVIDQANKLGAEEWELISVVKVQGTPGWRAFFKKLKSNF